MHTCTDEQTFWKHNASVNYVGGGKKTLKFKSKTLVGIVTLGGFI